MKVAIIGAGSVGATVAYACLLRGVADEIVLTSYLASYAGIEDVCMSVPCIVGREGVAAHLPVLMDDAEHAALAASADAIRAACAAAGA